MFYLKSRLLKPDDTAYQTQKEFDELIVNQIDLDFSGEGLNLKIFQNYC